MTDINIATSDDEISACYAVMTELRPHLALDEFVAQVKRQANASNFSLVYLSNDGIKAVAGIRIAEWLAGGKYLEIEDLVSRSADRSKGYGGELFDWIVDYAKEQGCREVRLVSHVKRFDAHRFYFKKRMALEAHYFSMSI
jgi:GNAT superfamily N-acetyltransferase